MSSLSKDVLRDYINEQNSKSPDEISAMKEMFRDVLQESLESEMYAQLGYDKYEV